MPCTFNGIAPFEYAFVTETSRGMLFRSIHETCSSKGIRKVRPPFTVRYPSLRPSLVTLLLLPPEMIATRFGGQMMIRLFTMKMAAMISSAIAIPTINATDMYFPFWSNLP